MADDIQFRIKVNGETVWESEDEVINVSVSTHRGEAAAIKSEDLTQVDLLVEKRSLFNRPLPVAERELRNERRDKAQDDDKVSARNRADGKSVSGSKHDEDDPGIILAESQIPEEDNGDDGNGDNGDNGNENTSDSGTSDSGSTSSSSSSDSNDNKNDNKNENKTITVGGSSK